MNPIAVISGDTHLRPTTWAQHPDLSGDAYQSFKQLVDHCLRLQVPLVLLGDIFDKNRPDSLAVMQFTREMDRMRQAELQVYCIQGNHDQANPAWFLVHPWPQAVHQTVFLLPGRISCYGLDFQSSGKLQEQLAAIPAGTHLLFCHQSWAEVQRVGHTDASVEQLPRRHIMVFSGDYHIHGAYRGAFVTGDGEWCIHSPGSTCLQALNEDARKYFFVLYADIAAPEPVVIVESEELVTRNIYRFTVTDEAEFDAMLLRMTQHVEDERPIPELQKAIWQARYPDSIPDAYTRLLAACAGRFHLFSEPQVDSGEVVTVDMVATPEGAFDDLLTAVDELVAIDPPVCCGVKRLLNAENPQAEIVMMFEEYKGNYGKNPRPE